MIQYPTIGEQTFDTYNTYAKRVDTYFETGYIVV